MQTESVTDFKIRFNRYMLDSLKLKEDNTYHSNTHFIAVTIFLLGGLAATNQIDLQYNRK